MIENLRDERTERILGAAMHVHRILGAHFQELTCQRALVQEFQDLGLEFGREVKIPIYYRGRKLHTRRVDFVVQDVIVEIKAKVALEPRDFEQTLSYLKASGFEVALLLNFGAKRLEVKRIANSQNTRTIQSA